MFALVLALVIVTVSVKVLERVFGMDKMRYWYILVVELINFIKRGGNKMTFIETLEGLHKEKELILFDPSTGKELTEDELNLMSRLSLDTCKSAIDLLTNSERQYTRLFDALKCHWILNCENDDALTDKIERCEAALTVLKNLGFNLCTGEVNKD